LSILQGNSCSIAQKSGGIWTVQTDLQQIYPKSDRLLEGHEYRDIIPLKVKLDIDSCLVYAYQVKAHPETTTPSPSYQLQRPARF